MNESSWKKTLPLFDENERRLVAMVPAQPMPTAKWCRESAHRTLGHLTACQAAWIPYLRQLREGNTHGSIPINPDPLFRKLGYSTKPWQELLEQFQKGRAEWRTILNEIDPAKEIQTPKRILSAKSLTRRMVEHEKRHIDQINE
jgi:hypothetical protein